MWSRNAGSGYKPGKSDGFDYMLHDRSNYASPSPVVGKQQVYYFYGNGDLVAYDFQGDEKWRRNLQKITEIFAFSGPFQHLLPSLTKNFIFLFYNAMNLSTDGASKGQSHSYFA